MDHKKDWLYNSAAIPYTLDNKMARGVNIHLILLRERGWKKGVLFEARAVICQKAGYVLMLVHGGDTHQAHISGNTGPVDCISWPPDINR